MTSISLPGASGRFFVRSVFTCWACVAMANPKVKINTERMSFFMLCIACVLSVMCCDIRWRGPKIKRDLLATPFQYLFLVYCSVEKLMHQRPNPIHFFFQREMARVEKMELCTGEYLFYGSIPETGFAIEDFQPLQVKRAIENGRRNRVRHLNSP